MTPREPAPDRSTAVAAVRAGTSRRALLVAAAGALGSAGVAACSPAPETPPSGAHGTLPSSRAPAPTSAAPTTASSAPRGSSAAPTPSTQAATVLATAGPDIRSGSSGRPEVALTFHGAGPASLTATVLEIARAKAARVTVFAVGQWLHANPALGRAVLAGGHDLGNHTWSHRPMRRLTPAEAHAEVSRGAAEVALVRGSAGLLFRPSGTPTSTAVIRAAARASGYARCISYDVDPQDYLDPGTTAVRERTLADVRAGSIVSLHLGHAGTVAALPGILTGLRALGLRAVTVSELLA
ncbi:polysaccharide deacetylase family protein [Terracoccus sp. 273MFTsu3.1]|uniref:polysaccharide deacetylase family protein n=1 Tax=Terracoccus sp. 273MFTsu3.1 TaxID=1172188 RepID=UPI0009DB72FE|nr:polysaccharide deacetylase family protein [Terracoccus sp. 273MFTsu3.1]